jgi:predicted type IV restriction endonuclease
MPTQSQKNKLLNKLKDYKKKYLKKKYLELDESATRLMVNSLLTEVFEYQELEEIKTEYRIRGEYADYVIQVDRKKHFIVEVKSIQLDISDKHLRQSLSYAANEGVEWIILTNGRQIELYRVIFNKPIESHKVFSFDLIDGKKLPEIVDYLVYLSKKSVSSDELEVFWKRFQTLRPENLQKCLYREEVVKFLRKTLKEQTGLTFSEDDVMESIYRVIVDPLPSSRPKAPYKKKGKK